MCCFYHYRLCQEAAPSQTEENIQRETKKREMDELRKEYIEEKTYTVVELREFEEWKTDLSAKKHFRESFLYKRKLRRDQLLEIIKTGIILPTYEVISKF